MAANGSASLSYDDAALSQTSIKETIGTLLDGLGVDPSTVSAVKDAIDFFFGAAGATLDSLTESLTQNYGGRVGGLVGEVMNGVLNDKLFTTLEVAGISENSLPESERVASPIRGVENERPWE